MRSSPTPAARSWTRAKRPTDAAKSAPHALPHPRHPLQRHARGQVQRSRHGRSRPPITAAIVPKSWLINGLKKIETLQFLTSPQPHPRPGRASSGSSPIQRVASMPAQHLRRGANKVNSPQRSESPAAHPGKNSPASPSSPPTTSVHRRRNAQLQGHHDPRSGSEFR